MYTLRDYQTETIDGIYRSMQAGNKTIIVQQPPRTGKTVIMAEIARRATLKGNRVLFVVHRKEIIDQARRTFAEQGVDMRLSQLGMVQTITRHVDDIPEPQVIFVDEGHHALAKTYQRILEAFPQAIKLLFTATPQRTGRQQLDKIADDIVLGKSIKWLTQHGNLAPFDYYSVDYIDRHKLKRNSTGDYTTQSMDEALDRKIYGNVVQHYQKIASGKQAVVYCYSIENAQAIAERFNQAGISAVEVDGSTDRTKRDLIIQDFREGKVRILTNVNLFTEGLDLPNVDCVIMVRPTASLALYLQFSMRCLNPREGKRAIIIDHVANWKEFGLPNEERNWEQAMVTHDKGKRKQNGSDAPTPLQCDYCYGVFYRKDVQNNRCPLCGADITPKVVHYDETNDRLQKITAANHRQELIKQMIRDNTMKQVADKQVGELKTLQEFQAYAKLHGYKSGWAYVMFNKLRRGKR